MPKTKIIATIGPACDHPETIAKMIKQGVAVFRFNTKHSTLKWHSQKISQVRKISQKLNIPVAILLVLRGPELRVGTFKNGQIKLKQGETVNFVSQKQTNKEKNIIVNYLTAVKGLKKGDPIFLDDGFLAAKALKISYQENKITAIITEGGLLKNNKSINFPTANLNMPSLIKKDLQFISLPNVREVDFFSYSFVRNKKDILALKKILQKKGLKAKIIAKIETKKAIDNFEEILAETDGIMVARGDLGIEIPLERVPFYQKLIIKRCREEAKPVIVATQMLESMVKKARPTRAEVTDVANAVYDGADALMLSGETASGLFPLKVIKTMNKIIKFTEEKITAPEIDLKQRSLSEMIAFSAYKISANKFVKKLKIKNFVVFTDTGLTANFLSRLRPIIPVLAITDSQKVKNQLTLNYGVKSFYHRFPHGQIRSTKYGLSYLKKMGVLKKGERVIIVYGKHWGIPGQTNTIKVEKVN